MLYAGACLARLPVAWSLCWQDGLLPCEQRTQIIRHSMVGVVLWSCRLLASEQHHLTGPALDAEALVLTPGDVTFACCFSLFTIEKVVHV